jgi:hypothetical protein
MNSGRAYQPQPRHIRYAPGRIATPPDRIVSLALLNGGEYRRRILNAEWQWMFTRVALARLPGVTYGLFEDGINGQSPP